MTENHTLAHTFNVYIPRDQRQASLLGEKLPDRTHGSALFADISGFMPLTVALARTLGPRLGAEELTHQLNRLLVFGDAGLLSKDQGLGNQSLVSNLRLPF